MEVTGWLRTTDALHPRKHLPVPVTRERDGRTCVRKEEISFLPVLGLRSVAVQLHLHIGISVKRVYRLNKLQFQLSLFRIFSQLLTFTVVSVPSQLNFPVSLTVI